MGQPMNLAHMGGWTAGAWALLMLFVALLAAGAVLAIARLATGRPAGAAREILDERLARGEIGAGEHRALLDALGRSRGPLFLAPLGIALAGVGLVGVLVVAAVAPGPGHGFMHMMGRMGSMMSGDAGRSGSPPVADASETRVAGEEFFFDPAELRVRAGETVNIVFENRGRMFHTLTVGGLGLDLRANGGDSIAGSVWPERPGTYPFLCTVPGHAEAGMRGTIEVE